MSIAKQLLRGLIIGLVLAGLILLGIYLARLPKPKPKHIRSRLGTIWMGAYLSVYVEEYCVPPYSKQASLDEYLQDLARGIGDPDLYARWLKKDAKYVVFVNLTKEEWGAVLTDLAERTSLEGNLTSSDPEDVILVPGWQAVSGPDGHRWVMSRYGYAFPESEDTFRSEVRHLDRAIRTALGKSLSSCLLYEGKNFDPSILELGDD